MSSVIHAIDISKQFTLGERTRGATLREALTATVAAPLERFRKPARSTARIDRPDQTVWALKDINFQIRRGESVGIIGRNGAGKSTLLKLLSRITAPTEGCLEVRGRVGSLLEVGTGFHPELTGRENIFLNGAILGMPRREIARKYDAIVEFSEIGKFIDTPVKRYSSGMYVRLAFAVAAHLEPDILLLDEVLSVGDLAFQRKCMEHMRRLRKRNVTLLLISHQMFAVKSMCSRAIYLSAGRVHADGPTDEIIPIYEQQSRLDAAAWAHTNIGADPARFAIRFTDVEMLDEAGHKRMVFEHGERMRLRLHFTAREPISSPNFNVAVVRNSDDLSVCNFNTSMDGFETGRIEGPGVIEVLTPPLKLVSDVYALHLLVWDNSFERLYCAQVADVFHVRDPVLSTQFGVFHESAEWAWHRPSAKRLAHPAAFVA